MNYTYIIRNRLYKSAPITPVLIILWLLPCWSVLGQQTEYPLVRTPQVTVQRTLPGNILAAGAAMPADFSKDPTDEEIFRVHFFEEPLVPLDSPSIAGENAALVYALAAYSQRKNADDFSGLLTFLQAYPRSRWRGSLLASMGIVYRRTGYFDKALLAWQESWKLLKSQDKQPLKVLADRVVSELLLLNAWVGRYESMDSLFQETKHRVMEGPASERIITVQEGRWLMKTNPGISFKCGPYALQALLKLQHPTGAFNELLTKVQSTEKGFSLSDLQKMARDIGLLYQMAFRQPGAPIIPRAVVHWKLDHYSALVEAKDGHVQCEDATMGTTYGPQCWLTQAALDSSASGYFLVPAGALPTGWRAVSAAEGINIFGKGQVPADNGQHVSDDDEQVPKQCNGNIPMAQSNVHASSVSLHIYDRPVYYTPPKGSMVSWDVDYHQRDSYQPANFSYSNMGPKWTFQWLSYIQDNPNSASANAIAYVKGGGVRVFTSYNATTKSYAPEIQTNDVLVRICPTCYELRHADGSKEVYARPDGNTSNGRKIFLTQSIDAAGNGITLSYDANLRLVALQDALGQVTTIAYENPSDIYKVTKVTDPFGRSASFGYDSQGKLLSIRDMIGIVSAFHYSTGDFIDEMTTPYGITRFVKQEGSGNTKVLETHYPQGEKERVEFRENAPGISFSETIYPTSSVLPMFNSYITYRNTFYWDRKAMQEAPGDYKKARILHWLHGSGATGENGSTSPMLESIKEPYENRVWYYYQNESSAGFANQGMSSRPSIIGRVLDDGSSQFMRATYNALGYVTSTTDPLGRKFSYVYDSTNINLLEVRQSTGTSNELLAQYTYNQQFLPKTIKDASGQVTSFAYNAAGQPETITNARGEKTTYTYDANGYLTRITSPTGGFTQFAYDGFGRVRTVTDPQGYTVTTDYDALDRPTVVTYPDNTYEQTVYEKLNAAHFRDRQGRVSHTTYDSLARPVKIEDALGRVTQYKWCNCGSLSQIIDPLNRVTSFTRDLQGRLTEKKYHDGKTIAYTYESTTAKLKQVVDAKGQKTQYSYYADNNVKQISYANAQVPTSAVNFTYDPRYNRIVTMTDGAGVTAYSYYPVASAPALGAGRLSAIDGVLPNDVITYTYDTLGRLNGNSINGVASSIQFDSLGRVSAVSNVLGDFGYGYLDQGSRLSSLRYPNGQSAVFSYYDNLGDNRLKQVSNQRTTTSSLSVFDYGYNPVGQITQWTQQAGNFRKQYEPVYDGAGQLTAVKSPGRNPLLSTTPFSYSYDSAGNKLIEHNNNRVLVSEYNGLNQLTRQWHADSLRSNAGIPLLTAGSPDNLLTYDDNGNMLTMSSPGVSYDWDAMDRLVKITSGHAVTEFVYDGLSRRVAEKLNGSIIRQWVWDGTRIAEERDASGSNVVKRFFAQGEQINGVNYYFTRDHLGSVREMVDAEGKVRAQYVYDPNGNRTKLAGDLDADFGFTGHYYHSKSGLHLALYRAYDAGLGRWISRDPIQEQGGLNLYGYGLNNPVNMIDLLGQDAIVINYDWYDVQTGMGFTLPLGHGGVVSIDPKSGITKYFEYGRYDAAKHGVVMQRSIPNVTIGKDGAPTPESLSKLYDFLSKNFGKGSSISPTYFDDADYSKVNDYATTLKNDPNRPEYDLFTNNCKTFAKAAAQAGRK